LLLAVPARADNTADESDIAFSQGNQHYAKRDYEGALAAYFLSYRLVPNRNVLFNIARCFEALDRFDEAYRYWFDLSNESGLADADLRDVKAALARLGPKVALVNVSSTPPGAELYVDREDLGSRGRTPQAIAVPKGKHTIIARLAGYRVGQTAVTATLGHEVKASLSLSRIEGQVSLTGTPEGAVVRESAEGPELGRLPAALAFPPGQRLLVVQAPGFLPSQVLVDVRPDATATAKVALTERPRPTGKVIVTANRDAALVRVDGRDSGFTPTVLTLPVGAHVIDITSGDVTPLHQALVIAEGDEQRIDAELRYAPPKVNAASKQALSIDQAPASVTVITREEIQSFGYQTLAQALQSVRGFFVTDDRIYSYLGIRGLQPAGDFNTRLLVLWDGHPTNDVWAGQGYSVRELEVDLSEVDHIEVIRGPASTLYGTGALFGVINVVPRNRIEGRNLEGVIGVGGVGGVKARATGSYGTEDTSALISVAGFNATGAEQTDLGTAGVVQGMDGERALGASARARIEGFTLVGKINQRRKQVPTAPLGSAIGVPGTEYTDARGFAEARWEHDFGRLSLDARASYDGSRYRGYYAALDAQGQRVRTTDTGGGDWVGGELRAGVRLFGTNRLSLSVESAGQFVFQQPRGTSHLDQHTRALYSATLLDEWQPLERLFVQVGVRLDKYSDLDELAFSPRGALVAKLYDGGLTKLIAGQAFRAPNIYELYFSDDNLTQRAPGSPLKPELITSFELEHSHNFTPELRATVAGYANLVDRLVTLGTDPDTQPLRCGTSDMPLACAVYSNSTGRLTALGAEAQVKWQPGRFTLFDATYSFVQLSDSQARYPTHLASLRGLIPLKEGLVRLSGQLNYQSGRLEPDSNTRLGEALLIGVGLSGEVAHVRYFAGVHNLLDARYALPVASEAGVASVPQYGRTFWLELAASL
jgi:outer membrane receptor for ferrienterochelin and colicin